MSYQVDFVHVSTVGLESSRSRTPSPALTVEVTFEAARTCHSDCDPGVAEGVVRMPDDTLRPFCGWIDLLAALEHAAFAYEAEPR